MNLIINAAEAIGDKEGTITVALTKTTFLEGHANTDFLDSPIPPGIYACLAVSDTGCGIDEETKKRIFEPFFTTKFAGRGLGMSAISGIIKSHRGTLQLASTPGTGTTFKLHFPLPAVQVNAKAVTADSLAPSDKARGTILLVDDEEALRTIGSSLLNAMGFSTLTAANGFEALELYRVRRDEIDLVMLDLIMPKMGGTEAYHELRKTAPVVPIIICSGYGAEAVEDVIDNDNHARFVIKPYKPLELRDLMVEMINTGLSPSPKT
jgi:CheY-like chemotaxis protein